MSVGHTDGTHWSGCVVTDHDARRRLAHETVAQRWSVRELERRARAVAEPEVRIRRARPRLHPDQEAAIEEIADSLGTALGMNVEVTAAAGGYRAHLHFSSIEEALALGGRLAAPEIPPAASPR